MKRLAAIALIITAGCTTVPPTNVHQPMTARPAPRMEMGSANGAIYQAAQSRPLFEDRRARFVGDRAWLTRALSISRIRLNLRRLPTLVLSTSRQVKSAKVKSWAGWHDSSLM